MIGDESRSKTAGLGVARRREASSQTAGIDDAVFYDNRLIGIHPRVRVAAVVLNECLRTSILKKSVVSGQ